MKGLIFACLLVAVVSASLDKIGNQFQAFKVKHGKAYKNQAEEIKRFNIFKENLRKIEEHNALYEQGLSSYLKGINQFTDMTHEEFVAMLKLNSANKPIFKTTKYVMSGIEIPDSVDWREYGYVSEVKNQNACGSCWSFSVTGGVEGAHAHATGNLVSLSEQQLVDCTLDVNDACEGGLILETFPYIVQNGLQSETTYPYEAQNGTCRYDASKVAAKISGYKAIERYNEDALLEAAGTAGPISVAIDASWIGDYASGIFTNTTCSTVLEELNHAVLIVGYGAENGVNYWIVKNSWSANYGEKGYLRMLRGINQCGISDDASYPYV